MQIFAAIAQSAAALAAPPQQLSLQIARAD